MGTRMSTTTAEEHNSVNNSAEIKPLLTVSLSESIKRYRGVLSFRSALGDFNTQQNQKLAVVGLVLCDFFRCMAIRTLATWIPFIIVLYDPIFAQPGFPKPDMVTKRLQSVHIASLVIINLGAVISGLVSDAWIRKTRMLLCGTVLIWIGFGYISGVMFELPRNLNCTMIPQNYSQGVHMAPDCSFTPLRSMGYLDLDGMALVYLVVVCLISGAQSTLDTLIPALAGDQMTSRDEVRKLYAWYYWIWKLGDTVSVVFCAGITYNYSLTETDPNQLLDLFKQKFSHMAVSFAIFVDVSATLSTLILILVICTKKIREYRPDVSVIVDSAGIWKQAWKRRKYRKEDEDFLSTALFRNGGDYPENSVNERANLGKFFCVLICLLPTSYSTNLPATMNIYNGTMGQHNISDTISYTPLDYSNINTQIENSVIVQGTGLVFIPIIYAVTEIINRRTRYRISLLHRLVAGQLCSVASSVFTVTSTSLADIPTLVLTMVSQGISNALIYTAGYELTILSAPRSMQATAMGMFYSIDGFTALVNIAVTYIPGATFTAEYYYAGIGLNVMSIVVLIVMEREKGLGLNEN